MSEPTASCGGVGGDPVVGFRQRAHVRARALGGGIRARRACDVGAGFGGALGHLRHFNLRALVSQILRSEATGLC